MAKVVITVTAIPPEGKNPPSKTDIYVNGGNPVKLDNGKGSKAAKTYSCLKWYLEGAKDTTFKILVEPNKAAKDDGLTVKLGANKKSKNPVTGTINKMGIASGSLHFWLE